MGVFFGTDGLRGRAITELSPDIARICGNSLASFKEKSKILIGTDTRKSCDLLAVSFAEGAMLAGGDVCYIGVCPTAGVSYLTKEFGFDYGVVISASHNPVEFNGIKIFDHNGKKLGDKKELELEKRFLSEKKETFASVGSFTYDSELVFKYVDFLIKSAKDEYAEFENEKRLKIVIDCSNGSASKISSEVFKKLGANVVSINDCPNGLNINNDCGSLHILGLKQKVFKENADIGFAYDGDSDRLIAVDEKGKIVDGDMIVYILAKHYKESERLSNLSVVGTKHTNMGVEKALNEIGIKLLRADIGDKYVSEMLEKNGLVIGGEQSGHVFVLDKLQTGDGILNSILLYLICLKENKKLSELSNIKKFHQSNINVRVQNKQQIMESKELKKEIKSAESKLGEYGRVMVRASGTESVIRIMTELENEEIAEFVAESLERTIRKIDSRGGLCVE